MKRILVYRIGSIGDNLVALPAFRAVRRAFPDAHICYLTNGETPDPSKLIARKLLPEGLFDEWIAYSSKGFFDTARLLRELRKKKFDAVFYLMTRNRSPLRIKRDVLFFRLAGIRRIFGVRHVSEKYLTMKPSRPLQTVETELEFLLECVLSENLNLSPAETFKPDLELTVEERLKAEKWLEKNFGSEWRAKKFIAVMASSNWESKNWAEENFVETVLRLIEETDVYPIVFGGPSEREQGNRFLEKWRRGANAAGELGLRGDGALLEKCSLYLGTDTGTMHLAGSVGTCCVAVFAATDYPGRWTPYGEGHRIFRESVECEGCYAPVCFNENKCLNLVPVEKVFDACRRILEND